ncbi:hypothetical protein EDB84DRAFT_596612 [Lactarius hengduanensis]|nr:hypothetical protein EDB84DRAFT_596612 [Lactarius hengduanensis]
MRGHRCDKSSSVIDEVVHFTLLVVSVRRNDDRPVDLVRAVPAALVYADSNARCGIRHVRVSREIYRSTIYPVHTIAFFVILWTVSGPGDVCVSFYSCNTKSHNLRYIAYCASTICHESAVDPQRPDELWRSVAMLWPPFICGSPPMPVLCGHLVAQMRDHILPIRKAAATEARQGRNEEGHKEGHALCIVFIIGHCDYELGLWTTLSVPSMPPPPPAEQWRRGILLARHKQEI